MTRHCVAVGFLPKRQGAFKSVMTSLLARMAVGILDLAQWADVRRCLREVFGGDALLFVRDRSLQLTNRLQFLTLLDLAQWADVRRCLRKVFGGDELLFVRDRSLLFLNSPPTHTCSSFSLLLP